MIYLLYKVAYLNGLENFKFLYDEKYKYTGCYFDKDDFHGLKAHYKDVKIDILLMNNIPSVFFDEIRYDYIYLLF